MLKNELTRCGLPCLASELKQNQIVLQLLDSGWELTDSPFLPSPAFTNGRQVIAVTDYLFIGEPNKLGEAIPIDLIAIDSYGVWVDFSCERGIALQVYARPGGRIRCGNAEGTLIRKYLVGQEIHVDLELDNFQVKAVKLKDCQLLLGKNNVEPK